MDRKGEKKGLHGGVIGCNVLAPNFTKTKSILPFTCFVQNAIYKESNSNSLNDSFSKTKKLPKYNSQFSILNSQFSLFYNYYKYQPITQSPFNLHPSLPPSRPSPKMYTAVLLAVIPFLLWLLKNANHLLYETAQLGSKRFALPPGNLGWPFIGNMWSFLRAFKSPYPDSFMDSFLSRSLSLSLSLSFFLSLFICTYGVYKFCYTNNTRNGSSFLFNKKNTFLFLFQ